MEIYDSEQEQIDALKKWWKDNGKTMVVGVVLGLGGVLGWSSWQNYTATQESRASSMFNQVVNDAGQELAPKVGEQGEQLVREFPDSGYAIYTKLLLAASAYKSGDVAAAKAHLEWVEQHGKRDAFVEIAKIRLAKVVADDKEFDRALGLLDEVKLQAYDLTVLETRGDLLVESGKDDEAAKAYRQALGSADISPRTRSRIQLKLDDLGLEAGSGAS